MALRIKNNVDLKELEKYGFELIEQHGTYNGFELSDFHQLIVKDVEGAPTDIISFNDKARKIFIEALYRDLSDTTLNLLYYLIQDGLVEKV